jgi:hypothetical protein
MPGQPWTPPPHFTNWAFDLAIVILPPPHDPAVLAPLAEALAQLR